MVHAVQAKVTVGTSDPGWMRTQLLGHGLTPFVVEMQTLLLTALFHPLNAQLSIMQCVVTTVSCPLQNMLLEEVAMAVHTLSDKAGIEQYRSIR